MAVTAIVERKPTRRPSLPPGAGRPGAAALGRAVLLALGVPCLVLSTGAEAAEKEEGAAEAEPWCEYCPDYPPTRGWVSVGVGRTSIDSFRFGRYSGLDDDGAWPYLSGWVLHRRDDGWYYEAEGTDLGLDSRDVRLEGGRQGQFSISVEYDETPFREDDTTSTPFRERRDDWLGLPALWTDAPTTREMTSLPFALREVDLETDRERIGMEFSYIPLRKWEITGGYSRETKEGTNDLGATIGFDQTVILPVPVDYQTDEYDLAVSYTGDRLQGKLAYHGSLFDDENASVVWRNPYAEPGDFTGFGRISTPPDNQLHQVTATLGYDLLDHTRVTGQLAMGRMTQDEEFLPYTINPAIPVGALTVNSLVAGVSGPAARVLQRFARPGADDLDATVDTTLAKVAVVSNPMPKLRLKADYTYSDRDNQSNRDLYRYAVTDLGRGDYPRVNRPYSFTQQLARVSAGYKLPLRSDISAGLDYDKTERTYQAVDETRETRAWAKLKVRPHDMVDLTLDYSRGDRDRSDYRWLYQLAPLQSPLMRVYHLAAREREEAGVSVSFMPFDFLTLGGSVKLAQDDYDDGLVGLREADSDTYTADLSFVPMEALTTYAYYTREILESEQVGSQRFWIPDWRASHENVTDTVGVGAAWKLMSDKLELSADLAYSVFDGDIDFVLPRSYPGLDSDLTTVRLSARYALRDNLKLGADYRYEDYEESDWSKGRLGVFTLPTVLSLSDNEQEYGGSLFSAYLRYAF
jgi:hypothetical protein